MVVKRSGAQEPFDAEKLARGHRAGGRRQCDRARRRSTRWPPRSRSSARAAGPEVPQRAASAWRVLERLRVARPGLVRAVRLGLQGLRRRGDFERELVELQKTDGAQAPLEG